jgi:hypothetical protein
MHTTCVRCAQATQAFPDDLAPALLFFAVVKGDVQAIRLLIALSGASPFSLQTHPLSLRALGRPLAKLMSKPSIQQQLQLLRAIMPRVFESGKEQRLTPHV